MIYILCALFLTGLQAYAMPTLYPKTFNRGLKNNTTSNYVADSDNPLRYYVLPPNSSTAKVVSLNMVTANVGFCNEIAQLQQYNSDTLALLNSMKANDLALKNQIDDQRNKLVKNNSEIMAYTANPDLQNIINYDFKLSQLDKRLEALRIQSLMCRQNCDALMQDLSSVQEQKSYLLTQRSVNFSTEQLGLMQELQQKKSLNLELQKHITELEQNWKELQSNLKNLYADFNKMFDAHAKREGGRIAISYDSKWTANVDQLKKDNPQYSFERIQTKNAKIRVNSYSKSHLAVDGAVLSFDVSGQLADNVLNLESYPESFSGSAVLNLLGVCPLLHPEYFGIPVANGLDDMSFGLTVSYDYPASMKYDITAHYNMHRMYELIKSQGTNGGFFSSSSWTDQQEQNFFKDSFWVDWKVQDDRNLFTEQQKLTINSDLRRQIMTRLASSLVLNNSAPKLALAGDAPETGAMVLSNSLNKACPANVYCKGASIVFGVLQAIFGSSDTQQSLKQISDVEMTDHYSNEQIVLQPMITTYR